MKIAGSFFFFVVGFFIFAMFAVGSHGNIWSGMNEDWIFWSPIILCIGAIGYLLSSKITIGACTALLGLLLLSLKLEVWGISGISTVLLGIILVQQFRK